MQKGNNEGLVIKSVRLIPTSFNLRASLMHSYKNIGKRSIQSQHLTKEEKTVSEEFVISNCRETFLTDLIVGLFRSI